MDKFNVYEFIGYKVSHEYWLTNSKLRAEAYRRIEEESNGTRN